MEIGEMKDNYLIKHIDGSYLYVAQGAKLVRVHCKKSATQFTYKKAENIINFNINKDMRRYWSIVTEDGFKVQVKKEDNKEYSRFGWQEISDMQQNLFGDLQRYGEELRNRLSQVDREICDIQHYIEFFLLDAAKGYKAYRMLKERLSNRRHIKEEISKVNCFMNGSAEDFSSGKIAEQLKTMEQHIYTPRVLDELFDNAAVNEKVS